MAQPTYGNGVTLVQWYGALHTSKPRFKVGTRRRDITGAEFIYGTGVTSNALGKWVVFQDATYTPILITNTPTTGIVAISMSANLSAVTNTLYPTATTVNWSWYLVAGSSTQLPSLSGLVSIANGVGAHTALGSNSGTAGQASAQTGGKTIMNAITVGASTASNLGDAIIEYPYILGVAD